MPNQLLVSTARDYLALVRMLKSGTLDHVAFDDARSQRIVLHRQLIDLAPLADKVRAQDSGVEYAKSIVRLNKGA